jgi:hypothetical protein
MWGVVGAIIGARLFHVVDQWDLYSDPLMILRASTRRAGDLQDDRRRAVAGRCTRGIEAERAASGGCGGGAAGSGHGHRAH